MTTSTLQPADRVRLQATLKEAQKEHGSSPWQDAWRRLRHNPSSFAAFCFLAMMILLMILTPLLPLQAPAQQRLVAEYQYQPPNWKKARIDLGMDLPGLVKLESDIATLKKAIASAKSSDEKKELQDQASALQRKHPLTRHWPNLGPIARLMARARLSIFGDWTIPSICGTDELGRDILSRIMWATRVSLVVGLVATSVSLMIGVAYGATSAFFGGWVDRVMMRLVDILYSIPFIFVVIYALSIFTTPALKDRLAVIGIDRMTIFYVLIGAIFWLTMARVVRGQVLSMKQEAFIDAARTMGASNSRIIFFHLIPNVLGIVVVYLTLTIPSVILFESFLSYLGFGVQPPDVSLGLLVNDGVRVITPVAIHWWLVLFPGLMLALILLALNVLGDGLRDALDPRLKNR